MSACRQRLKQLVSAYQEKHRAAAAAEGGAALEAAHQVDAPPQESTASCGWVKQLRLDQALNLKS